jgi:hypothetical protein
MRNFHVDVFETYGKVNAGHAVENDENVGIGEVLEAIVEADLKME